MKKYNTFIFDIDGTLANRVSRGPFEWSKVHEDELNKNVANVLRLLQNTGNKIVIFTGRDWVSREDTLSRLRDNNITYDHFSIRKKNDYRCDTIVKREMFENLPKEFNVVGVFDDRNKVVKMRRELGLTCFQVNEGDF